MSVNCVFIIFLYFFANVSANNVTQDGKPRIIGGSVCKTQDHRFMVSITTPRGFAFCGGTLLNSRWVLTAAHCRGEDMFVYAGRNYQSEFKKFFSVKIEKAYPHPYYNKLYSDNDIALHRLAKPVPQDARFVKYVKLPDKPFPEDISKQCKEALAMGWGVTDTFSKEVAKALQCVTLPVISPDRCGSMYSSLHYYISNNMICTYSAYNKDACQGDSGGPLMCGDTQIGIVSWGQGCADYRYPGVYTRVDKYLSFINITMIKHGMSGTTASSIADSLIFFLVLLSAYLVLEI